MDREGKATRTGNEAESREGSLNATLGAEPQLTDVGEQAPPHPFSALQPPCIGPSPLWKRTRFAGSRKAILSLPLPWWALLIPKGFQMPQKQYFQEISRDPVNLKASRSLGPAWPLQPGSLIDPLPVCSPSRKYLLCCCTHLGWQPRWNVGVHGHRTHTALDQLATGSSMPNTRCSHFLRLP